MRACGEQVQGTQVDSFASQVRTPKPVAENMEAHPFLRKVNKNMQTRLYRRPCYESVDGTTPTVAENWLEATEMILDDMECTLEQKLKGTMSLLHDEAYRWWQAIVRGTQAHRLMWEYFLEDFRRNMWASELMMQVASLQERVFKALVEKTKIHEEVRHIKRERKEQERIHRKRELTLISKNRLNRSSDTIKM
ncbi:hypothetical protein V6Z11_D04G096200 [Gossypium hirsutum]